MGWRGAVGREDCLRNLFCVRGSRGEGEEGAVGSKVGRTASEIYFRVRGSRREGKREGAVDNEGLLLSWGAGGRERGGEEQWVAREEGQIHFAS